ncbi:MAG TPA: glycosyltransferase [Dongiaceae bacterium]|nr:glycosyltransferase [Dongiaceae bacterium]
MKIEWFSPLPPCKSGIAVYTHDVAVALAGRADVRYWNFWGADGRDLASRFDVVDWHPQDAWAAFNDGGIPIYHFGNNGPFHWPMWTLIQDRPGIAVIHDGALLDLAVDTLIHRASDRVGFARAMREYYGVEGAIAAKAITNGQIGTLEVAPRFPFIEYVLDRASAAIVHTHALYDRVTSQHDIPVLYAPLPLGSKLLERTRHRPSPQSFHDPLRVIVFGHLAPNRRLPSILSAIARSSFRHRLHLTIAGKISGEAETAAQITALGLDRQVELVESPDESRLAALLARSDVAMNLRFPSMGEASHSQLHLWANGLPTLVTRTGWYAEQPPDTVVAADPYREMEDIEAFLVSAFEQPMRLLEIGQKGRDWVSAQHAPSSYVTSVLEFAAAVGSVPTWTVCRSLSRRIGRAASSLNWDARQLASTPKLVRAVVDLGGIGAAHNETPIG